MTNRQRKKEPDGRNAAIEVANVKGRSSGAVDAVGIGAGGPAVNRAAPALSVRC